ncbi:hypothetical protein MA16_Dca018141 [Dendrobium catenatum]|uniref:Uncharacterized protein n=1 Tax=Dendrobium catenatum TaxID=906689 RepID=A0A2I0WHF4_9ASPA|nr:hypothetical protein MA16_Dca018141 [Dendrobium catenatum]
MLKETGIQVQNFLMFISQLGMLLKTRKKKERQLDKELNLPPSIMLFLKIYKFKSHKWRRIFLWNKFRKFRI